MVTWQVTATTVYCDAVEDEITIIVYNDWSVKCTGHKKYGEKSREAAHLLKRRARQVNRQLECAGLECHTITEYKQKLLSEEPKT